jgi:hypothetical protein
MTIRWITPAGNIGTFTERITVDIPLSASSTVGNITYSVIAGRLPRGLRLRGNSIVGSPTEVRVYTTSRFVIRASDGEDIEDRTFSITIDGDDIPEWITNEGFLNVGPNNAYFVLDNSKVDFQLDVRDPDLVAGDKLEYFLIQSGGELPPGLTLSRSGRIFGFTDPIFALEYTDSPTGAYDSGAFDIIPLDASAAPTVGFDSFLYDFETFDTSETSKAPRRLSRFYTFVVGVSDGIHEIRRLFRIWVVTEEFLKADNTIVQVDTNLFQADSDGTRTPIWITESDIGRIRANNFVTIFLEVYNPPSLPGSIVYFLLSSNPDGSPSQIPPGLTLDPTTGTLAGRVPYQSAITKNYTFTMQAVNFPPVLFDENYVIVGDWDSTTSYELNQAVRFNGFIWLCREPHRNRRPEQESIYWELGVSTSEKTFSVDIIGEIESAIAWISDDDLGTILPNIPSTLKLEAEILIGNSQPVYELVSGRIPPGLELIPNGQIQGKVRQFTDLRGPGLTRFYEKTDTALDESSRTRDYDVSFDGFTSTFDREFKFSVKARDVFGAAENIKEFTIRVNAEKNFTFSNLYLKAFQSKEKRLEWYNFITDSDIFREDEIYRFGDPDFGIQSEIKMLLYAGIESRDAQWFIQAMSRNHYRKQLRFGDPKSAVAKDPITQEVLYETIYVEIVDEYEKNGKSISREINLSDKINSKVLVSYDAIKVDSDIPFVSDSDHQRIFPNSFKNMRSRIKSVGERDRLYLPLWMRSIQPGTFVEPGFVKALVLCYLKPGFSPVVLSRLKNRRFDFKNIDFTADRYLIDAIGGEIENKYLAFRQRGEKLP